MNPLDLTGPEFLRFYAAYGVVALVLAALVRWLLASIGGGPAGAYAPGRYPGETEAYHVALLQGRAHAVQAALARLAAQDAIAVDGDTVRAVSSAVPASLHPLVTVVTIAAIFFLRSSGDNSVSGAKATARSLLGNHGWGSGQFSCLEKLWQKESGWNYRAYNSSSGAYGIPQALPGSKMGSAGSDWKTSAATQIRWGLGYIDGRYGSPCGAWDHSQSVGWY